MKDSVEIKGAAIDRDPSTRRVVKVTTAKSVSKASRKSEATIKSASSKRRAALARLANR